MTINVPEQYLEKVNTLIKELPTINFVIDMVGKAVEISHEIHGDTAEFEDSLELATRMAGFAKEVSEMNFYETSVVLAPLLIGAPDEKIRLLDTASGRVATLVKGLEQVVNARGWKERWLNIVELNKTEKLGLACVFIMFNYILEQILAKPIAERTVEENIHLLGFGYIEVCIRQSGIVIDNTMRKLYNDFGGKVLHQSIF